MTRPQLQRVLRVFYRDPRSGTAVPSSRPESLMATRIAALAERVLVEPDAFIGVVDRNDAVLQLWVDEDPQRLTLELIHPEARDGRCVALRRGDALRLLHDLPEVFDNSLLPRDAAVE